MWCNDDTSGSPKRVKKEYYVAIQAMEQDRTMSDFGNELEDGENIADYSSQQ